MAFDNMDLEEYETEEQGSPPPEKSSNRNFYIVAGVLGAIMILTLICTAVYAMVILPGNQRAQQTEKARIETENAVMALSVKQTEDASKWTPTSPPTATRPPATATATATSVVATATRRAEATEAAEVEADPRTATVAALLTQAAEAQLTAFPTSTLLPNSGFADDIGLPSLLGMGVLLIVVIFLARRLRTAS
jgi:Tfp pilus assembly protein PilV